MARTRSSTRCTTTGCELPVALKPNPGGLRSGLVGLGITPEQASRGAAEDCRDEDLARLAAEWLADGWDSEPLRELAAMSSKEAREGARGRLEGVLVSLGFERLRITTSPWEELPWRGYWSVIAWARDEMDGRLSPYAAAQRVLEVLGDVPDLWEPGQGDVLMGLLARWDEAPDERSDAEQGIRELLRSLRAEAVPPLLPAPPSSA